MIGNSLFVFHIYCPSLFWQLCSFQYSSLILLMLLLKYCLFFFCMNTMLFPCLLCINGEFSYILHVIYDSEIVFKCHKLCLKSEYTRISRVRIYYLPCTRFINFCQTLSDITIQLLALWNNTTKYLWTPWTQNIFSKIQVAVFAFLRVESPEFVLMSYFIFCGLCSIISRCVTFKVEFDVLMNLGF